MTKTSNIRAYTCAYINSRILFSSEEYIYTYIFVIFTEAIGVLIDGKNSTHVAHPELRKSDGYAAYFTM